MWRRVCRSWGGIRISLRRWRRGDYRSTGRCMMLQRARWGSWKPRSMTMTKRPGYILSSATPSSVSRLDGWKGGLLHRWEGLVAGGAVVHLRKEASLFWKTELFVCEDQERLKRAHFPVPWSKYTDIFELDSWWTEHDIQRLKCQCISRAHWFPY